MNIYRKGIGPSEDRTATDATNSATNATDATEITTNATELTEDEKLIIVAVKHKIRVLRSRPCIIRLESR